MSVSGCSAPETRSVGLLYYGTVQAEARRGRHLLPNARLIRLLESVGQRLGPLLEENEPSSCVRGGGRRIFVELIRQTRGGEPMGARSKPRISQQGGVMTAAAAPGCHCGRRRMAQRAA